MKNNDQNNINSGNQIGGIIAKNVTINNHHHSESNIFSKIKVGFKNKRFKWITLSGLTIAGLFFTFSSSSKILSKEDFYKFLLIYFQSVNEKNTDAKDYFADNISVFYLEKNINPDRINKIRQKMDYEGSSYNINKMSITLRKGLDDINYWRFETGLICYRPSKNMYEKCNVEMEYGINSDDKITSIKQIKYWDLEYAKERPNW